MKITGDFHTHTIYSCGYLLKGLHAKSTIEENVKSAFDKGLKTIVISEHGASHYLYGVRKKNLIKIRNEIDRLNEIYSEKGLFIMMGLESNLIGLDGQIDVDDDILKMLDILLMGFHYGSTPKSFKEGIDLYFISQLSRKHGYREDEITEAITESYVRAIKKYPIKIITHPGAKVKLNLLKLAKEAEKKDVALEVNSRHGNLSLDDLKMLKDINVKFYINSDAHKASEVGNFKKGIETFLLSGLDINRVINAI
ncbi:MAG: PHP domain-containing protein [Tissierellales bacterium]|nr:PHP domain-containing protein [Tissierellales bacterium]